MGENNWEHLQPLRIPGGWTIDFNKFENAEPQELAEQDKRWLFAFTEDILLMHKTSSRKRNGIIEQQKLQLDLGWYPDGEPDGAFLLQAILNDNWETPLLIFHSKSKDAVVKMLEQWLFQEFMPPVRFIEEHSFRKNHP
ncbi:MAG: hypothetical protein HFI38_06160 [Lachnospiraceae bacterium]|jgi:hypothetical protein|nr:hypothetical protein [Lachnospiraceae bacterium]